ncbi:hypothetical protein CPC08DRAFT_708781, partial [Agrocybe pediades]
MVVVMLAVVVRMRVLVLARGMVMLLFPDVVVLDFGFEAWVIKVKHREIELAGHFRDMTRMSSVRRTEKI